MDVSFVQSENTPFPITHTFEISVPTVIDCKDEQEKNALLPTLTQLGRSIDWRDVQV